MDNILVLALNQRVLKIIAARMTLLLIVLMINFITRRRFEVLTCHFFSVEEFLTLF